MQIQLQVHPWLLPHSLFRTKWTLLNRSIRAANAWEEFYKPVFALSATTNQKAFTKGKELKGKKELRQGTVQPDIVKADKLVVGKKSGWRIGFA